MAVENERMPHAAPSACSRADEIEQVFVNGDLDRRVPHNLNMSFNFVEGESPIMGVKGLAVRRARRAPRPAWSRVCAARARRAATSWRTPAVAG